MGIKWTNECIAYIRPEKICCYCYSYTTCKIRKKLRKDNRLSYFYAIFAIKLEQMARKMVKHKPKNTHEAVGIQNPFNNEKTDFLIGVFVLLAALYVIIAMVSFFSSGASDQSLLEDLRPGEWLNTDKEFTNTCGSIGAIISYFFITVNFGIPSFLIPAFMILVGLKMMKAYRVNLWKWFFCMMIIMIDRKSVV